MSTEFKFTEKQFLLYAYVLDQYCIVYCKIFCPSVSLVLPTYYLCKEIVHVPMPYHRIRIYNSYQPQHRQTLFEKAVSIGFSVLL